MLHGKQFKVTVFALIIAFLSQLYTWHGMSFYLEFEPLDFIQDTRYKGDVLIGMLTTSNDSGFKRRKELNSTWLNLLDNYNFDYIYTSEKEMNDRFVFTNESYYEKNHSEIWKWDQMRAAKRVSIAEFFYTKTKFKWLFVTCDDITIDMKRLQKFIDNLEKRYDTYTDTVVLGNTIGDCWFQGGIGCIMSRKAAQRFVDYGLHWTLKEIHNFDDKEFNKVLKHLNLEFSRLDIGGMIGHTINFDNISSCEDVVNLIDKKCGKTFLPLDSVFSIHNSKYPYGRDQMTTALELQGTNVFYYDYKISTRLCRFSKHENLLEFLKKSSEDNFWCRLFPKECVSLNYRRLL